MDCSVLAMLPRALWPQGEIVFHYVVHHYKKASLLVYSAYGQPVKALSLIWRICQAVSQM